MEKLRWHPDKTRDDVKTPRDFSEWTEARGLALEELLQKDPITHHSVLSPEDVIQIQSEDNEYFIAKGFLPPQVSTSLAAQASTEAMDEKALTIRLPIKLAHVKYVNHLSQQVFGIEGFKKGSEMSIKQTALDKVRWGLFIGALQLAGPLASRVISQPTITEERDTSMDGVLFLAGGLVDSSLFVLPLIAGVNPEIVLATKLAVNAGAHLTVDTLKAMIKGMNNQNKKSPT